MEDLKFEERSVRGFLEKRREECHRTAVSFEGELKERCQLKVCEWCESVWKANDKFAMI